ncbi:hypothetical protein JOB18_038643, partial [Solea senegalensis]
RKRMFDGVLEVSAALPPRPEEETLQSELANVSSLTSWLWLSNRLLRISSWITQDIKRKHTGSESNNKEI